MTERSLSREQVDRLLDAIDRGEISLDEGPARPYPPRQVDLGPVRGVVERWVDDAARLLENWLILQVSNSMTCSSAGLMPRGTIKAPPAALSLVRCDDEEPLVCMWDRDLADAMIAGMLGYTFPGDGYESSDSKRSFTEIDLRMLGRAATGLAQALTNSWPRGDGRVFEVAQVAGDAGALGESPNKGPAMAGHVVVRVGDEAVGGVEFALPGWIGRELRSVAEETDTVDEGAPEMREVISSLDMDVEVLVPVGQFTLRQLLDLREGEQFELPSPLTAVLRAGGVACQHGVPGIIDGRWAVSVGSLAEGEEHADE